MRKCALQRYENCEDGEEIGLVQGCGQEKVVAIEIASSNQMHRQQERDEPVRENTHLVLNTLASRLRELSLNCRS